jgi:hypothetical protein
VTLLLISVTPGARITGVSHQFLAGLSTDLHVYMCTSIILLTTAGLWKAFASGRKPPSFVLFQIGFIYA